MTASQSRGYRELERIRLTTLGSPQSAFAQNNPLLVEIGFGMGQALVAFAESKVEWNCIGIDVYRPGIGALVRECESHELENLRIVEGEALSTLTQFPDEAIEMLWVFFPDPWPKRRHHKRRLVGEEFVSTATTKLRRNGKLYIATDWEPYAEVILEIMDSNPHFEGGRIERPDWRPQTKFEDRGLELGHEVFDLRYTQIG